MGTAPTPFWRNAFWQRWVLANALVALAILVAGAVVGAVHGRVLLSLAQGHSSSASAARLER